MMLNLTSMIDVIFLLLIYFLVTWTVTAPEDRLDSGLQVERDAASGSVSDFQPQIVDVLMIDGRPSYRLGSRMMFDQSSLAAALAPLDKASGLFIRVGPGVSAGFVVAAMQAGEEAGFRKRSYVASN
jgi:biopolymer transport protein ExbD